MLPALRTRVGLSFEDRRLLRAHYEGDWGRPMPRRRFRPVTLDTEADGRLIASVLPWRGSGDPFALARADGLAILPENEQAPAGGVVDVIPVGEGALIWGAA